MITEVNIVSTVQILTKFSEHILTITVPIGDLFFEELKSAA